MIINVFGRTSKQIDKKIDPNEIRYGRGEQPSTTEGKRLLKEKYAYLLKMSDSQLLSIMWDSGGLKFLDRVGSGDLKKILETNYRNRTGKELFVNMPDSYWVSSSSNDREGILRKVRDEVQKALESKRWSQFENYSVDCSSILDKADINFRTDIANPSLAMPMGGVQEIAVRTIRVQEEKHNRPPRPTLMDFSTTSHKDYAITLEIRLRDRFAVDEGDFSTNDWKNQKGKTAATALGREALTAFWILQHQRGYPPFKWNAIFQSTIRVHQPVKK
ncbi:hypothetical protein [Chryseobacterium luteum]|uniref:Uncharacterized protein n=1 Tax=Chryseobacterium luteum TaxID=421531 RepID=A0A085ZBA4_9FLAO|nr:hypothetical protein [Chryseobacterium luteum]KFF01718.1 hypothetical protein IX38_16760 [Chryseobacterium luteum]